MSKTKLTLLLILSMFFWGSGWSALKILTYNLPMEVVVFWRFFFMTLAFVPVLIWFKKPLHVNGASLRFVFSSSILNLAFMFSSFYGIKYGYAGAGSVIITTLSPVMTFLLIALLFRKKLRLKEYFALFLGVLGGYILVQPLNLEHFFDSANFYFLSCALIWAGVTLLSEHAQKHIHPIHYSFYISVVATVFMFFYTTDFDRSAVFSQSAEFWVALLYLAVFGQTIATTVFFLASAHLGSGKTSSFMFLVPLFALLSATVVLKEPIELHVIIGGLLGMSAIYFINKR